jgi:uncharacterized protein
MLAAQRTYAAGMFNFLPKDDKFFDQLDEHARILVSAAQQLTAILQTFPRFDGQRQEIEDLRRKSASLAQQSLAILDRAFITPFDREDILSLIDGMDSVVDRISEFSERLVLYPLKELYPNLTAQSRNLLEFSIQVEQIMADLRKKATLSEMAEGSLKKLATIEEHVRHDRREFLKELFQDDADPIEVIKKKDLHDLLGEALARLSNITQILARVLLKNA